MSDDRYWQQEQEASRDQRRGFHPTDSLTGSQLAALLGGAGFLAVVIAGAIVWAVR